MRPNGHPAYNEAEPPPRPLTASEVEDVIENLGRLIVLGYHAIDLLSTIRTIDDFRAIRN